MERYTYKYTKYRFRGLPLLVLGEDNKFYKLPFESNGRYYSLKELKVKNHKGIMKLYFNNKRYTKEKLSKLKYKYIEILEIIPNKIYIPNYENTKNTN